LGRRKSSPLSFEDVNGGGLLDLVVYITTEALQFSDSDTEESLKGSLLAAYV